LVKGVKSGYAALDMARRETFDLLLIELASLP